MARLILLADDSPTIQRRAQGILQGEGFEVETVSNGVAAIKKLPKMHPVLVLADVSMPGKDGYEVCDYVKTSADLHHVPVLLVASDLEPYDELRGAQVGADGIIKKPFAPHDLIAMVAKFAALGEASAPPPALPETLAPWSPVAPPEVSPMGSEPEGATGKHEPDLAAPSAGMAFAEPPEIPATPPGPLPDISLQPSLQTPLPVWAQSLPEPLLAAPPEDLLGGSSEPVLVPTEPFPGLALEGTPEPTPEPWLEVATEPTPTAPESISGSGVEPAPEPTVIAPEPTPELIPEAAPESVLVSPESIFETIAEPAPEPTVITPEPTPEPIPESAPESVQVSPESISGTGREATSELASVVSEPPVAESGVPRAPVPVTETVHPPAEAAPEAPPAVVAEEPLLPTEPALAEQQVKPLPPLRPSPELVKPAADRTLASGVAAETAGPMLIDELAPAPPAPEPPPFVEGQQPKPMAATSLDSFSLAEAAEGQVYIAPPGAEAAPSPEAGVVQPGESPEHPPSVVNPEWVYVIVHKVVTKMAPPVLPPDLVGELIRELTEEITAELNSESSQPY
ncbi:MAG: response regulator [Terriglobia bacterium]